MKDFLDEHKLLIISGILIVAFFTFAIQQKPAETESTNTGSFKSINMSSPMYRGSKDAKVSIIQYSDFLCPSCSVFSTQVMPVIDKTYIQTDKANFEFRPMAFIADGSFQAGMGGYCAIDQNEFWTYHDAIYGFVTNKVFNEGKDPKSDIILTADIVKTIAKSSGLDSATFDTCLDSKKYISDITDSTNQANKYGVTGTPYIMVNGQLYQGNMAPAAFEALIKANL